MANGNKTVGLTTTPVKVFDSVTDGGPAAKVYVGNDAASANYLLVNIPSIHGADFCPIRPGSVQEFEGIIDVINVKSEGTSTYFHGVNRKKKV